MPLNDDIETNKRIKKIRPEAIVMIMTDNTVEDLVKEAMEEEINEIIYKPLDIEKMVDIIEEAKESSYAYD